MAWRNLPGVCLFILLASCGGGGGEAPAASAPPVATLAEPLSAYEPGRMVTISLALEGDLSGATATLGGLPLQIDASAGAISFLMPDVPAGRHVVQVAVNGSTYSVTVNAKSGELIADPAAYVGDYLAVLRASLQADIAVAGPGAEADALQGILDDLVAAEAGLGALSAEDMARLARSLSANDPGRIAADYDAWLATQSLLSTVAPVPAGISFGFKPPQLSDCQAAVVNVIRHGGVTLAAAASFALFTKATLGSPWMAVGSVVSFAVYRKYSLRLRDESYPAVHEHCISEVQVKVLSFLPEPSSGIGSTMTLTPVQDSFAFRHRMPSRKDIRFVGVMDALVPDRVFSMATVIASATARAREVLATVGLSLPTGLEAYFRSVRRESEESVDAADIEVVDISNPSIEGALERHGAAVELRFSFSGTPPSVPVAFAFKLRDKASGAVVGPYQATLAPLNCTNVDEPLVMDGTAYQRYFTSCFVVTGSGSEEESFSSSDIYDVDVADAGHVRYTYSEYAQPAGWIYSRLRSYFEETGGQTIRYWSMVSDWSSADVLRDPPAPGTVLTEQRSYVAESDGTQEHSRTYEVLLAVGDGSFTRQRISQSCSIGGLAGTFSILYTEVVAYDDASRADAVVSSTGPVIHDGSDIYCLTPGQVQQLYYMDKTTQPSWNRAFAAQP